MSEIKMEERLCLAQKRKHESCYGRESEDRGLPTITIQTDLAVRGSHSEVICGIDKGSIVTGLTCIGMPQWCWPPRSGIDAMSSQDGGSARSAQQSSLADLVPSSPFSEPSIEQAQWESATLDQNQCRGGDPRGEKSAFAHQHHCVEDVQVDIARLNDPTLRGSRYQDPTRLDENLRIACLMRDGYTCQTVPQIEETPGSASYQYRQNGGKIH